MVTVKTSSENNLETFSLIWLDASVNNSSENIEAQQQLRSSINHLKTFENQVECELYIRSLSPLDRIVFIVSDQCSQNIVSKIHQLRQISIIYIYGMDKKSNKQFTKIRGVIGHLDELIVQIRSDQKERQQNKVDEPLTFTTFNSHIGKEKSTTGLNGQFVHSQLLIDHLLRMTSTSTDMKELICVCQEEYRGNWNELKIVREFEEDYSSDRSLWWYTRESFVYRMLNKALRVQNIDLLFLLRFLVRDLGEQLDKHRCSLPLTVYRGQLMFRDELELLKQSVGELVSMNSFLSTSLDRSSALSFLYESNDLERVLFEIDADPRVPGVKSFANITPFSYFPGEEEILFMLGSIFRIVNILPDGNEVWTVRLTLCSDQDHDLRGIFDHMKDENGQGTTNLHSLGNVLWKMGKFDEAEKYYRRCLSALASDDHLNIAVCYYQLGAVAQDKSDYQSSLDLFSKSLEIFMRIAEVDASVLADTHNAIAVVYEKKGDTKRALESYNKALEIFRRAFGEDHKDVAMCFNNMGIVHEGEKRYSEALNYYQKALAIRQKRLPADHPRLGDSHNNIGNAYRLLGQSNLALEHYDISLKICKKSLPPQHPDIAMTLSNIGLVYEQKSDLKEALSYYKKASIIYRTTFLPTHPNVINIEENIRRVLSRL